MKQKKVLGLMAVTILLSPWVMAEHPHSHVTNQGSHQAHAHPVVTEQVGKEEEHKQSMIVENKPKVIHERTTTIESTAKTAPEARKQSITAKTKNVIKDATKNEKKSAIKVDSSKQPKAVSASTVATEKSLHPSKNAVTTSVKHFFESREKGNSMNGYQAINFSNDPQITGQEAAMISALVVQTNNKLMADTNGTLTPKEVKFNQAELEKKFADKKSAFYISYVNALNKINQVKTLPPDQELFGPKKLSNKTKIIQGSEGDCYFLSAVNGLLYTPDGAKKLEKMIAKVPGEPNQFEVTFPNGVKNKIELTDAEIGMYSHVEKGGKWLAILSIAEAKQLSSADPLNPYKKRLDPEAIMNGGYPGQTLSLLTGKKYVTEALPKNKPTPDQAGNIVNTILTAQKNNMPITISTPDHVLTIVGCENCVVNKNAAGVITSVSGNVLIKNPWGSNGVYYNPKTGSWTSNKNASSTGGPQYLMNDNGEFTVPINQITNGFGYITYHPPAAVLLKKATSLNTESSRDYLA